MLSLIGHIYTPFAHLRPVLMKSCVFVMSPATIGEIPFFCGLTISYRYISMFPDWRDGTVNDMGRRSRDRMVVGFATIYAISAYHY